MGDKKYIHLAFMVGALIASWFFIQTTDLVWSYFARPNQLIGNFIGIIIGMGLVGYFWLKESSFMWMSHIVHELKRVTWPSKQETYGATIVVLVTVFISAALMGFFDTIWSFATKYLLKG